MINIAEILKDCPKGTKLYSPICGNCKLLKIYNGLGLDVINDVDEVFNFSYDGRYNLNGECCIFPSKDNRDWNTFRPFKDGDILTYTSNHTTTFIYRNKDNEPHLSTSFYVACNDAASHNFLIYNKYTLIALNENCDVRLATEDEKIKLFDAIKANGYKWNAETKTLEKLIVPKFKVGDQIVKKNSISNSFIVNSVSCEYYGLQLPDKSGVGVLNVNEQDDWEVLPQYFFNDGDIIAKDDFIVIFSHSKQSEVKVKEQIVYYHCYLRGSGYFKSTKDCGVGYISDFRFASESEKQKLFNAIKENGYKWNSETKTLEKIIVPKFKAGDKIKEKNERFPSTRTIYNYVEGIGYSTTIHDWVRIEDQDNWELVPIHKFKSGDKIIKKDDPTECWYVQGVDIYNNSFYFIVANGKLANLPLKDQDEWELAPVPKFKVGDIVETKRNKLFDYKIIKITDTHYTLESIPEANTYDILICEDEYWRLVHKKFDISTLKAYDKVLVRDTNKQMWVADLFGHAIDRPLGGYTFACVGHYPNQCIPYEGNEHLLGTINDCDEYYKNW